MIFSFCESVYASGRGPWHLRYLTDAGPKFGGGIDTSSLCGIVRPEVGGWDLSVALTEWHLRDGGVCVGCIANVKTITEERVKAERDDEASIRKLLIETQSKIRQASELPMESSIELTAPQHSPEAELYLRHLGHWPRLLGVGEVRVNIRAAL